MKRLLFIYNPRAGKELLKPRLSDIIDIFVKAGYEVTVYPTQAYRDAYKKVLEYDASNYDLIVCSGGDGTIDEVVTGMMHRKERTPVGYIPTGTTNDFANRVHSPMGRLTAADNALNGVK
ncbi:MAG: acylglycerol kinase family protein, partial [Lachnospiraceae bacterium]|nr:acylglycerol kinase family protein [Lachnospiraceae bacterium]